MDIVLARMIQLFAEEIGFPVMQHYDQVKSSGRMSKVVANTPPRVNTRPPVPPSDTTRHMFYGRVRPLEQPISRQIAVTGVMPQIASIAPRLLPAPPLPTVFSAPSTATTSSSTFEANGSTWTAEDIKHYAVDLGGCEEAGRRAIVEQVSTRLPDIFTIIRDLERRVEDL